MKSLKIVAAIIIVMTAIIWAFGCGKDKTTTGPSAVHDTIPPAAIANLAIIGGVDSTCLLSWTAPGNDGFNGRAARYDIRYATDSGRVRGWTGAYQEDSPPPPLSPMSLQQYLISGLNEDSTYYFAIKTIDDSGNVSEISNIVREAITPIPEIHITTPANGSAIADLVEISASATDDKGIVKVEFFVDTVLIATDITPPYQTVWNASAKPHGSTHVIFGRATDTDNNTAGSSTVVCTVDTVLGYPAAPILQPPSAITDSSVTLTWSRSMENDFNQYIVAVDSSQTAVSAWRQVKTQSVNDTTYTVILEDNWAFRFRVSTRDAFGHISPSNIDSAKTLNRAPRSVTFSTPIRQPEGRIRLSWSANTNYDFTSYIVFRSDDSLVNQTDLPIAVITRRDSIKFTYQPPDSLQMVYYAVFVEDRGGSPSNSSSVQAISARPIPSTIYPETFIEGQSIGVVWSRSRDRNFSNYRLEVDTSATFLAPRTLGPITGINDTTMTVLDLIDNEQYFYRVKTATSEPYYALSDNKSVMTVDVAPPASVLSVAGLNPNPPMLRWTRPTMRDFKEYRLYRSSDTTVTTADLLLAAISNYDSLAFQDNGLSTEGTYYYGLMTEDTAGMTTMSTSISWWHDAPPPPATLSITGVSPNPPILRWTHPNMVDFKAYRLYRSLDSVVTTADVLLATISNHDSLAFEDNSPLTMGTYYYGLMTEDNAGMLSVSNTVSWWQDALGYALHFSGSQYCVIPSYSELNVTTAFTVEAWVYPEYYGNYVRIVDKSETACCFQYNLSLNNGKVWIDVGNQTGSYSRIGGNTQIPLNTWSHIAVTFNSGTVRFYINGSLDKTLTTGLFATVPSEIDIGRRKLYNEFYHMGAVDEIRIWSYARSESEMAQYYNKVVTGLESGLIGYWRLDEGSGDVIHGMTGSDGRLGSATGADAEDPTWIESTAPILY